MNIETSEMPEGRSGPSRVQVFLGAPTAARFLVTFLTKNMFSVVSGSTPLKLPLSFSIFCSPLGGIFSFFNFC